MYDYGNIDLEPSWLRKEREMEGMVKFIWRLVNPVKEKRYWDDCVYL
jgi:hypothetical protein